MSVNLPPERSRILIADFAGPPGDVVTHSADTGLYSANRTIWYLQPNNGLIPGQASTVVIKRHVASPRPGPLPAIPVELVASNVIALYEEGPPIFVDQPIPMSAGFLTPLRALLFASLAGGLVLVGLVVANRSEKRALAKLEELDDEDDD
jgi:hypothetical protein